MKIYLKGNLEERNVTFGYRELAEKMWFKEKNGKALEISHVGNDEDFKEDLFLMLSNDKWLNDARWGKISNLLSNEDISMELLKNKNECFVYLFTKHIDILTVDKRALFLMAVEVAQMFQGLISEDEQQSWLSISEFKHKHRDILALSYEAANEMSLKEAKTLEAIEEPWEWDEEE